jgi:hypothetical protein
MALLDGVCWIMRGILFYGSAIIELQEEMWEIKQPHIKYKWDCGGQLVLKL